MYAVWKGEVQRSVMRYVPFRGTCNIAMHIRIEVSRDEGFSGFTISKLFYACTIAGRDCRTADEKERIVKFPLDFAQEHFDGPITVDSTLMVHWV